MEEGGPARLDIGSTLKQTRQRLSLDIREVEDRTKIRIKYLRALENEEWDVLPGPTYVRGYLRAYADLLELGGEVLADEYRRQFEDTGPVSPAPVDGVLSGRRQERPGDSRPRRVPPVLLLLGLGALIVIVIIVVAIVGGSDGAPGETDTTPAAPAVGDAAPTGEVRLAIVAETEVEVCALDANQQPLIDSELLAAGTREGLGKSSLFSVDLSPGIVRLIVDGVPNRVSLDEPATYEISSAGLQELAPSGPGCP